MTVATAPELCQKCDFLCEKVDERNFTYVQEFMLTSAKMHDDSTLMEKTSKTEAIAF